MTTDAGERREALMALLVELIDQVCDRPDLTGIAQDYAEQIEALWQVVGRDRKDDVKP